MKPARATRGPASAGAPFCDVPLPVEPMLGVEHQVEGPQVIIAVESAGGGAAALMLRVLAIRNIAISYAHHKILPP